VSSRRSGQRFTTLARAVAVVAALVVVPLLAPPAAFAAPANDDFAAARPLGTSLTGQATGVNLDATKQPGEPDHAGNPGGHSVWFSWTAPNDGNEAMSTTASDFDTLLAVYTGSAVNALTAIASNDDLGAEPRSTVSFRVARGVTYLIAVDGFFGKRGRIDLRWAPAPANDNFADAQVLPSLVTGRALGSTRGSTREPGEPESDVPVGRIWYRWTAPAAGTYKVDTVGSQVDTVLGVYRGGTLDSLTRVGLNDDDPDRGCCTSWVPIRTVAAGETFSFFIAPLSDESDDGSSNGFVRINWGPLVLGSPGADRLVGTARSEELRAGPGDDVAFGGGGNDVVFGGRGEDELRGGPGNDAIVDHRGTNRLFGGPGADVLDARDVRRGRPDLLSGGPGKDRCLGKPTDVRRSC
jgi:Ca2+-binding RTX toxin-like protein